MSRRGSLSGRPLDFSGMVLRERVSVIRRFASKTDGAYGRCWWWKGATIASGYGQMGLRHNVHMAHRISYALFNGPVLARLVVMHSCDNRRCVNPDHLSVGTQQDNVSDAAAKGRRRYTRGEQHYRTTLTADQVHEIRRLYKPGIRGLAKRFGVNRHTIRRIGMGLTWKESK